MIRLAALLLLLLLELSSLAASVAGDMALPGCRAKCGNVNIPYPFGIGQACSLQGFNITCNESFSPHKPFLSQHSNEVVEIKLSEGLVVVNEYMAYHCYDKNGGDGAYNNPSIYLGGSPYKFSDTRNKFIAVGCDTIGYIYDEDSAGFQTGCLSVCNNAGDIPNGTCSGIGCCEAPIPKGLQAFKALINSFFNHTKCWGFNPCSYGFLADDGRLNFSVDTFSQLTNMTVFPLTLDWAIGNQSCEEARSTDLESFACKAEHSYCSNSTNGPGYRCNCSEGFRGNPYLKHGCHDIDECKVLAPCIKGCKNIKGSYACSCPWDMYGDGKKIGSGCKSIWKLLYRILVGGFSTLILVVLSSWIYWIIMKRRHIQLKEKFFKRNGGLLLQRQFSSSEKNGQATRIFTKDELIKATDNYKESRILGQGGVGTVYKGILADKSIVAIKKCKLLNNNGIEQFINEVVILSNVNHKNVLKLLGCCLDTRIPLLVYEYMPNETLFHHLHSEELKGSLSLECRLRIAVEIAEALAYLHSAVTVPIVHRDVKSSNILLNDNYTAKVADFGTSRLVPFDQEDITSLVRGTFGYLDPEYFYTTKFTDKSDVYSFGVVLVELLTGKKPVERANASEFTSLAMHFISCFKEGYYLQILEDRVLKEGSSELLAGFAGLARRCLSLKGEERPTMKEVAIELEVLRTPNKHLLIEENEEKKDDLFIAVECFTVGSTSFGDDSSTCNTLPFSMP